MNRWGKRVVLVGLMVFSLLWVEVMSVSVGSSRVAPSGAGGLHAQVRYVDDSRFPMVTAYLAVTDSSGQVVSGLSRDRFTLEEDGIRRDLTAFVSAGQQPLAIMLVIDRSGSMEGEKLAGAKEAARAFVGDLADGRDSVGLVAFNERAETRFPLALLTPANRPPLLSAIDNIRAGGTTALYNTLYAALDPLESVTGRKAILALTDGQDNQSGNFLGLLRWGHDLNETAQQARTDRVPVYTIGLGADADAPSLTKLASVTGAEYHYAPTGSELAALYRQLGASLQNEYALTYESPTPGREGSLRVVSVAITTPDGLVTTGGDYDPGGVVSPRLSRGLFAPLAAGLGALLMLGALVPFVLRRRRSAQKVELPAAASPRLIAPASASPRQVIAISLDDPPSWQAKPAMVGAVATCPECGREIRAEARYCWWCGTRTAV